jgi:hypothetical protein
VIRARALVTSPASRQRQDVVIGGLEMDGMVAG